MLAVIIGRRRQGKSTLALSLAMNSGKTTIVFDPNNQYQSLEIIPNIAEWMETADSTSVGRILPVDPVADFEALVAELDGGEWRWGEYALVVDECSMLMTPSKVHPALERYARTSPKDVDTILTTHRSVDVNTLYRALATDWFVFNQYLDLDLQYLQDHFGAEFAEQCKGLGEYHVNHHWLAPGGGPMSEIWADPSIWFVDIGRRT